MSAKPKTAIAKSKAKSKISTSKATSETAKSDAEPSKTAKIFQLKISLVDTQPLIWRRIQIPVEVTFENLYTVAKDAMGWCYFGGCYLFYAVNPTTKKNIVISKPQPEFGIDCENPVNETKLADYLIEVGDHVTLEYPLGESWLHNIELEQILTITPGTRVVYPKCIDGMRACPPGDVGGCDGYNRLLKIMADPEHEEYDELHEWLDDNMGYENFKPASFRKKDIIFTDKFELKFD